MRRASHVANKDLRQTSSVTHAIRMKTAATIDGDRPAADIYTGPATCRSALSLTWRHHLIRRRLAFVQSKAGNGFFREHPALRLSLHAIGWYKKTFAQGRVHVHEALHLGSLVSFSVLVYDVATAGKLQYLTRAHSLA